MTLRRGPASGVIQMEKEVGVAISKVHRHITYTQDYRYTLYNKMIEPSGVNNRVNLRLHIIYFPVTVIFKTLVACEEDLGNRPVIYKRNDLKDEVVEYGMLNFAAVFLLLRASDAARILGFLPFHGTSHNMNTVPLFVELAKRGHNVTLAGFHSPKTPVTNMRMIQFKTAPGVVMKASTTAEDYNNPDHMTTMRLLHSLFQMYDDNIGYNNNFSDIYREHYDVVIVEMFESDLFMGFMKMIDAPFIIIHNCEPLPWHRDTLGDPLAPSVVPHVFGQRRVGMDFAERFFNTLEILELMLEYRKGMLPRAQSIAEKYLGPLPPLYEITKNASLYFTNTHSSLFGSRPMNPTTIEIGGLHISSPKPLSKDLKNLLDGAKNKVIYFSLGSVLKGSSMSSDKRDAVLKVFSELKETVLWKWEEDLPYKPPNLHTSPWFPQRDIFAHPNVVLYIGHCGLLGIHEAVTESLPIICLPMFGDQHFNAEALKQNGMGLSLNYADINEELFRNAISEVLEKPSYKENAKRVSAAFLDRPLSPMDTAVYWTEYVIRHKGAHHLRSPARWMTWYEYYNLDVLAVLAAVPLLALLLLYKMLAAFIRTLCCRGPGSAKKVKRS